MQHINRLLIKAKRAARGAEYRLAVGFVDYDEGSNRYIAKPQPWDGKPGTWNGNVRMPDWWHDEWATEEEAADALQRLFDGFGIPENNTVIFFMDYGVED